MGGQPSLDLRGLVSGAVVQDEVQVEMRWLRVDDREIALQGEPASHLAAARGYVAGSRSSYARQTATSTARSRSPNHSPGWPRRCATNSFNGPGSTGG
jgi:hypothetical protein